MSTNAKKIAIKTTTTNTTSVICTVSLRVGHTTFFASKTTLFKKVNNYVFHFKNFLIQLSAITDQVISVLFLNILVFNSLRIESSFIKSKVYLAN